MKRFKYLVVEDHRPQSHLRNGLSSALQSREGQQFLQLFLKDLDALSESRLISPNWVLHDSRWGVGECETCLRGEMGIHRTVYIGDLDLEAVESPTRASRETKTAMREIGPIKNHGLLLEILETPEEKFTRTRNWAAAQIR